MRKLFLLLVLLAAPIARAQSFYSLDPPAPNANFRMCAMPTGGPPPNPCTTPASIFNDKALLSSAPNPTPLGPSGTFSFWVASGQYVIQLSGSVSRTIIVTLGGGTAGTVTSVTGSSPLGSTGGTTPNLTCTTCEITTNKNAASGYAGLDAGSLLTAAQVPNNAANTSGTAANLSGTPALPNGTTATTQSPGDNTTKLATTAFVAAATPTFATIGAGTNTNALLVGTGGSLAPTGSGSVSASTLATTPTVCGAGQVAQGITANGNATGGTNAGVGFGDSVVVAGVLPGGNLTMLTGTTTSGSPNFSATSANWDSSMVGYLIRANSATTGNIFAVGTTVLSVTDPTHGVASANASASSPGTATIGLYPRDETATINAAIATALSITNCGSVIIPRGVYLITSTFSALLPTLPAGCTNWGNGAGPFFQIVGFPTSRQGKGTSLSIPADFDWTTCTGGGGSVCFPNIRASDFNFNGQGYDSLPAGAQNKTLVVGSAQNFGIHHMGSPAITNFKSFAPSASGSSCLSCFFDNTGPVDWGGNFATFSGYIEGTAYLKLSSNGTVQMGTDGTQINGISFEGGAGQVFCGEGAILSFNSIAGSSAIVRSSTTGPTLWLDGCQISTSGAGSAFITTGGNNLTVHSTHATWSGTPTNALFGDVRYYDECGNGAPTGSVASWTGTYQGDCSISGSPLVTGNVALTSGWDTSTKGTFTGSSRKGQFTVTLAGTPTSPAVITLTFPVAFRFTAPVCSMSDVGGTNAVPTSIATGTVTTTTAAFTITHTPVAGNTEIFNYDCRVP